MSSIDVPRIDTLPEGKLVVRNTKFGRLTIRRRQAELSVRLDRRLLGIFPVKVPDSIMALMAIDAKYESLGGESGFLGRPETEVQPCADKIGYFRNYKGGSIFWRSKTGAHELHGAIRDRWFALGSEKGFLGYPVTDELPVGDTAGGRYQRFQHGSLYWTSGTGAHEVHGAILDKWKAHGAERGFLGYPISDAAPTSDGAGRFSNFQHGAIYWSPDLGAFEVHGGIQEAWNKLGRESSFLGYPISDELPGPDGGRLSLFQRGNITWTTTSGSIVKPEVAILRSGEVKAGKVTGWAEIGLSSDGFWSYRGHVHDSAFFGDNYAFAASVQHGDTALLFKNEGTLGGTLDTDSRDEDWQHNGHNPLITSNWEALRSSGATFVLKVDTSALRVLEAALLTLVAIAGVAAFVIMHSDPKTDCDWQGEGSGVDMRCRREFG